MPESGDLLTHFRLIEKIGEGGMGAVWKAVDTKLGREVAIKILPPEVSGDTERLDRFKDEAKAVAALNHPNIVTIHSVEEAGGLHFFSMELVQGQTLADRIPRGGLPLDRFFELALPLTDAIRAAHEKGVTHRDLKPNNVMVTDEGRVKILDFGLAETGGAEREVDPALTPTQTLTQERNVRGTMPYMSPEQVKGKVVDHRSDVFSLGAILYEMTTGERPFDGETPADIIAAILRDDPRPVGELNRAVPRPLERIILHALERDRGKRFQTALELHNQLAGLEKELESGRAAETARAPAVPESGSRALKSIAVLPLSNLSGDPAQDYFADGMTEALITDLAKIADLKVISRTSVMRYRGIEKPLREVAEELGVGAIVEGSVMRAGNRVRINAQLIDAVNDESLWAERYDRDLEDVLELQSEVAQAVAGQIQARLTAQEQARFDRARKVDPAAHEAYLKGRHFWYKRTADTVKRGLQCFERAIEIDPGYAPAWAGLADSYLVDDGRYLGVEPMEAYAKAREGSLKALELDPDLAEAHTSLGAVMTDYEWDWEGAQKQYERAIELNPSYITAHYWYADHLSRMGLHEQAIERARRAEEIDPVSPLSTFFSAWARFWARDYDRAVELARKALDLEPGYLAAWRLLGWACEERGRYADAIDAHGRAGALSGGSPHFEGQLGRPYALSGRTADARGVLDGLVHRSREMPVSALDIAIIHAALGDTDSAFEWLEKARREHSEHIPYLKVNPRVDSLRSDPRFEEILASMKLTG